MECFSDLHDNVDPKWHCAYGPQKHHESRQTVGLLLPPVVPYLRDQLDTPEDGADGAKDVCRDGDGGLRCHCLWFCSLFASELIVWGSIDKGQWEMGSGSEMSKGSRDSRWMRAVI